MTLRDRLTVWLFRLRNSRHRLRGWKQELTHLAQIGPSAALFLTLIRADGTRLPLGLVSRRLVTTAGVNAMVDAFQNLFELENFNFHDSGTGTTAEAIGDTTLVTPAGHARVSGTQTEPAANQYRSQATVAYTSTLAITEHGLFSAASGGTLLDRSVFSAVNVNNGDSIQFTYTLTINAGG